jgi:hypothetical protein
MTKTPIGLQELRRRIYRKVKSDIGWRRWSNEHLYEVLGLYWDWKIHPLPSAERFS